MDEIHRWLYRIMAYLTILVGATSITLKFYLDFIVRASNPLLDLYLLILFLWLLEASGGEV